MKTNWIIGLFKAILYTNVVLGLSLFTYTNYVYSVVRKFKLK